MAKTSQHRPVQGWRRLPCAVLPLVLAVAPMGCEPPAEVAADSSDATGPTYYVRAGAPEGGDGSRDKPFATLAAVQAVADPGASIHLLPATDGSALDGGIALEPDQKLIAVGEDGSSALDAPTVRLVNTTSNLDGVVVRLASGNEVAGIHFVDLRSHGIAGGGLEEQPTDLSGTRIHHSLFTGASDVVEAEEVFWAVRLESEAGSTSDVEVHDIEVRDGAWLGGIQVTTRGEASGQYRFARNRFSDLGGRAYNLWSRESSRIEAEILDSSADNIGVGDKNADSILPRLWDHSAQKVTVRNFHYRNTKQVGNRSNCGLEGFLKGPPFPGPEGDCDGCRLSLAILDSRFEDPVTDGIQLVNFGSNSQLDVEIRGTTILRAKPQQVGGGISLLAQNERNHGSRSTLLVENSEVIDSGRFGIAVQDRGDGYTSTVDLGGGALGSAGNNRIVGSAEGEVHAEQANPVAKHDWWGRQEPRISTVGEKTTVEWQPALAADPGSPQGE